MVARVGIELELSGNYLTKPRPNRSAGDWPPSTASTRESMIADEMSVTTPIPDGKPYVPAGVEGSAHGCSVEVRIAAGINDPGGRFV